jgi:hypothetical protein
MEYGNELDVVSDVNGANTSQILAWCQAVTNAYKYTHLPFLLPFLFLNNFIFRYLYYLLLLLFNKLNFTDKRSLRRGLVRHW